MAAPRSQKLCVAPKEFYLITRQVPDESRCKLTVLLAEDNPVNRVLAQKLLQKQGHTVTSVNNGREAVKLWEQNQSRQFDVILMDVQMPGMDGLQASTLIREKELATGAHIPIIAVTAHAMKGDRERCLTAGMDGYITKPIQASELFATIESVRPCPTESTGIGVGAIVDEKSLRARLDNDEQLLQELTELFRLDSPRLLSHLLEAIQ